MSKLSKKNLTASSGADALASLMATLTTGMDLYPLPITDLKDAPEAWNFYRPLTEGQFFELVDSIHQNGLISPLLVWDQGDGDYIILSGHNRRRAMAVLLERTGDKRYETVHCLVKPKDSISEEEARMLLIDANWCQRQLSATEKARSIYEKYVALGRGRAGEGRIYERLAGQYGLRATQVYQYLRLKTLEEAWLERLDKGEITIKAGVWLSRLQKDTREALLSIEGLLSADILKLPNNASPDDVEALRQDIDFKRYEPPTRMLKMRVPKHLYEEAYVMLSAWIQEHAI